MRRCSVLIVEDEQILLRFVRDAIDAESGLHVTCAATTAAEARGSLKQMPPDIAVVDGVLPDGSSFSLIRAIRNASPHAYIIGMSATPTDATAARFTESGVDAVVDKRDILGMMHILRQVRADHCPDDAVADDPSMAPASGHNPDLPAP